MTPFFKKENTIQQLVFEYLDCVNECLEVYTQTMKIYFQDKLSENFSDMVRQTHVKESTADDKRKTIELTMYEKSLIPESRGDMLGFLETFDHIPNSLETVCFVIETENLMIPNEFVDDFKDLVSVNSEAVKLGLELGRAYFSTPELIREKVSLIDKKETESDILERKLIKRLFGSQLNDFQKILLKDLTYIIGEISDKAESFADRINILSVKKLY